MSYIGIDPGASAIHCVVLDDARRVIDGQVLPSDAIADLIALATGATAIAIDAPAALSTAPHAEDPTISGKFRMARCCEIALGRQHRLWVPWVTPVAGAAVADWMQVGFRLYAELTAQRHAPIEVYPHAGFQLLGSSKLPKKTTLGGIQERWRAWRRRGSPLHGWGCGPMMGWMRRWRRCLPCERSRTPRSRLAVAMTTRPSGSRGPVDTPHGS
jgi:hypothetical protein